MKTAAIVGAVLLLAVATSALPSCRDDWCAIERVGASEKVPVMIAVKHANLDKLDDVFWAVSTPGSARFRKFLTLDELNKLIANPNATSAVKEWVVTTLGVDDMDITKGGEFVRLVTTAGAVEREFGAEYYRWKHASTGRTIRRSISSTIPSAIAAHVDFIAHVSEFPRNFVANGINVKAGEDTSDTKVTPEVIFNAYNVFPHTADHSTSMAVFEALGQAYSPNDLATFEQQFNVPSNKVVDVIGPNKDYECASNPNDCTEANLDVQYILGVAQGAALTFWSIAADDKTPYYDWIVAVANDDDPPKVQSVSYGDVQNDYSQSVQQRTNVEFQKMGSRGLSIFIAAGDDGVANFPARSNSQYCGFNPSWPAASPYVTAVGATQFVGGSPSYGEEGASVLHHPPAIITTGGGFSAYDSIPSYQSDAVSHFLSTSSNLAPIHQGSSFPSPGFNAKGRGYPDIAALGHNFQVIINGNQYSVDGTSCAAPVAAGMFALINHKRTEAGKSSLGFLNPTIYQLAGTSSFTDITKGTNNCAANPGQGNTQVCCDYGFDAQEGWDPVSGVGTPVWNELADRLMED
mmetsp:Transcript_54946/g.111686  ORF Transcript_54946/g.111686 Transcript_54946/m.111686 type:complete len:576 (+) Transcript_54946:1-1728(+)